MPCPPNSRCEAAASCWTRPAKLPAEEAPGRNEFLPATSDCSLPLCQNWQRHGAGSMLPCCWQVASPGIVLGAGLLPIKGQQKGMFRMMLVSLYLPSKVSLWPVTFTLWRSIWCTAGRMANPGPVRWGISPDSCDVARASGSAVNCCPLVQQNQLEEDRQTSQGRLPIMPARPPPLSS